MRQAPLSHARSRLAQRPGQRTVAQRVWRIAISPSATDINLRSLALAAGWNGAAAGQFVFTDTAAALLGSTSTATSAITRGSFPLRSKVILRMYGKTSGKGGDAGVGASGGGPLTPGAGQVGGPALDASAGILFLELFGTLQGGGGGGDGGGFGDDGGGNSGGGGGGGGGAGIVAGSGAGGGAGQGDFGVAGGAGASGTAAAGGAGGTTSGLGAGAAGSNGGGPGVAAGSGHAAGGAAIIGSANVRLTNNGTLTGALL